MRSYVDYDSNRCALPDLWTSSHTSSADVPFVVFRGKEFHSVKYYDTSFALYSAIRHVCHYLNQEILPNPTGNYYEQPKYFWDVFSLFKQTEVSWSRHKSNAKDRKIGNNKRV